MRRPTHQQLNVLRFIASKTAEQGYPPTFLQIRDAFGWSSNNAASCHVELLRIKGLLVRPRVRDMNRSRTLQLTDEGYLAIEAPRPPTPRRSESTARVLRLNYGWRCSACKAMTFDTSKPCPMCALGMQRSA